MNVRKKQKDNPRNTLRNISKWTKSNRKCDFINILYQLMVLKSILSCHCGVIRNKSNIYIYIQIYMLRCISLRIHRLLLNLHIIFKSASSQPVSQQLCGAVTLHQSSITNDNVTWPTQHRHSLLPRILASVRQPIDLCMQIRPINTVCHGPRSTTTPHRLEYFLSNKIQWQSRGRGKKKLNMKGKMIWRRRKGKVKI